MFKSKNLDIFKEISKVRSVGGRYHKRQGIENTEPPSYKSVN